MRIQVMDIGPKGLTIDESLSQEWISSVLTGDLPTAFRVTDGDQLKGRLTRYGGEVLVEAGFDLHLQTDCSSCLKRFSFDLPVRMHLGLKPRPRRRDVGPEERELTAEELETAYYEGDVVDLEGIVREQAILALPMFPKCREDCRGLCPVCGTDLNQQENCGCQADDVDPRWAALKEIKLQ